MSAQHSASAPAEAHAGHQEELKCHPPQTFCLFAGLVSAAKPAEALGAEALGAGAESAAEAAEETTNSVA